MGGIAQGIGAIGAAGIQAAAETSAANTAANASEYAAQQQYQAAQNALGLQSSMFNTQQSNIAPWLSAGQGALGQLTALTQPGQQFGPDATYPTFQPTGAAQNALAPTTFAPTGAAANALNPATFTPTGAAQAALNPATFQAPTAAQAAATPGYQFAYQQGLQALQQSEAATGALGGAAAKAAQQYGQGLASTTYQQAYGNALNQFQTNQAAAQQALGSQSGLYGQNLAAAQSALGSQSGLYGQNLAAAYQALGGQQGVYGTQFNTANLLQQQAYNRLAGLSGTGQQAVSQLGSAAQQNAAQAGNTLTSMGNALAGGTMGAAQAQAAGMTGLGNTLSSIPTALGQINWGGSQNYYPNFNANSLTESPYLAQTQWGGPSSAAPDIGAAGNTYGAPSDLTSIYAPLPAPSPYG